MAGAPPPPPPFGKNNPKRQVSCLAFKLELVVRDSDGERQAVPRSTAGPGPHWGSPRLDLALSLRVRLRLPVSSSLCGIPRSVILILPAAAQVRLGVPRTVPKEPEHHDVTERGLLAAEAGWRPFGRPGRVPVPFLID
jgi:hypothetical protein